jgi:isopenicillin N synthase-like dioxygenase
MHLESAELETGSVPLHGLPLAQLETVHFDLLRDGDLKEARKLFEGCQKDGFFYLDIQNLGNHVLDVIEQMYRLDYDLYSLPDEEKMLYDIDKLSKMKLNG